MPIVVPIRAQAKGQPTPAPPPDPIYALMAASQMHSEGRLIKPVNDDADSDLTEAQGNIDYLQRKFDMGMALFKHDDEADGPNRKNYKDIESAMEEAIPGISKLPAKIRSQLLIAPSYEEGKKIPGMNQIDEDNSLESGPRLGTGQTFKELWGKLQKFKSGADFKRLLNKGDSA